MRCSGRPCRALSIAALVAATLGDLRAQPSSSDPVITVDIATSDQSVRRRAQFAAREAWADYSNWLGPRQPRTIVVTGMPWRSLPSTMDVESMVAYEAARLWWRDRFGESPFVNGIAWYLQGRVVERLYDLTFERPGHSSDSVCFFGCAISWPLPALRLSRWNAGLARGDWQQAKARWPFTGRRLPASLDADAVRIAIDLASFEHSASWPALQAALFGAANVASPGRELADVLNGAAGVTIVEPGTASASGDLAITSVSDAPCSGRPCRITRVSVIRDDRATNKTVPLRVEFADGRQVVAAFDGDERARDFEFESNVPYLSAELDPGRTVLSDVNLLNNAQLASPSSNLPVMKWMARWVIWLQDAMLTYSALF